MKKPTLMRVISIAGITIAAVGIAVFVILSFGDNKNNTNQPASEPVAKVQSQEELQAANDSVLEYNKVTVAAKSNDASKTVDVSYAFASNKANSYQTRLDAYRVCMQAAFSAKDTAKNDKCYTEAKALLASTNETEQFKSDWQNELDAVHNGTTVPTDNNSEVQQ